MALPLLAPTMTRRMSPWDVLDVYAVLNQGEEMKHILQTGEVVTAFQVSPAAEATAAGLLIADGGDGPRYANRIFALQVSIDPARRGSGIFEGAGITLGIEVTFSTNLSGREKRYTFGIKVVRK